MYHSSLCYTLTLLSEGTGKSFVGALCAKILLEPRRSAINISRYATFGSAASAFATSAFAASSDTKILVTCYTNHALDQFLEDLINIGIPKNQIVRIGSKPNQKTAELSLHSLRKTSGHRMSRDDWDEVECFREIRDDLVGSLHEAYSAATARHQNIMQYIADHHPNYAEAFRVPESTDGTTIVGRRGRAIGPNYLLDRWLQGQDAGPFKNEYHIQVSGGIWEMGHTARLSQSETWEQEMVKKGIDDMLRVGDRYNWSLTALQSRYRQGEAHVLRNRKIIGCTTTGAAMHRSESVISTGSHHTDLRVVTRFWLPGLMFCSWRRPQKFWNLT